MCCAAAPLQGVNWEVLHTGRQGKPPSEERKGEGSFTVLKIVLISYYFVRWKSAAGWNFLLPHLWEPKLDLDNIINMSYPDTI